MSIEGKQDLAECRGPIQGGFSVDIWDYAAWLERRADYEELLLNSSADALFLSWDWIDLWWKHLSPKRNDDEFRVYTARLGGRLVAAMPLFASSVRRLGLSCRAVNVVGGSVRDPRGVFSEYLDVVARKGFEDEARVELARLALKKEAASEFSVGTTREFEAWMRAMRRIGWPGLFHVRLIDPMVSYQADLSQGFDEYLRSLSGNARRSLYNLRLRLAEHGDCRFEAGGDIETGLATLNDLHARRWESPAFSGPTLAFYRDLARRFERSGSVRLSRLIVGGRCVSVLFDLRRGDTQYNIQMGFDPDFRMSVSLGLLHLGYAMEDAASNGVRTYDFLAGTGKKSDYKKRISSRSRAVMSVQFLRNPAIAGLYRAHDWLRLRSRPPAG